MDTPFNVGDPVRLRNNPNKIGTVTEVLESVYNAAGNPVLLTQVTVSPPGRKFTTIVYCADELEICNCAIRNPRRLEHAKRRAYKTSFPNVSQMH